MGFMDLEKASDMVNMEPLWYVLRMYDVGGKLVNEIDSIFTDILAYFRVK